MPKIYNVLVTRKHTVCKPHAAKLHFYWLAKPRNNFSLFEKLSLFSNVVVFFTQILILSMNLHRLIITLYVIMIYKLQGSLAYIIFPAYSCWGRHSKHSNIDMFKCFIKFYEYLLPFSRHYVEGMLREASLFLSIKNDRPALAGLA